MRDLDETDLELVRLLIEDGRRPFSDLAERVGLSAPAVSDRIDRLREQGVIRGFTIDVDRSKLRSRVPIVLSLEVKPLTVERVFETVSELEAVEHAFQLFDGRIVAHANAPDRDVHAWFRERLAGDLEDLVSYEIAPVSAVERSVGVRASDFAISCVVCDNPVTDDGVTARIDGSVKAFCCPTCRQRYEERYESHSEELE